MHGRQLLRAWIKDTGRRQVWVAEQLGITAAHLSRLLSDGADLTPGVTLQRLIAFVTRGAVPVASWSPDLRAVCGECRCVLQDDEHERGMCVACDALATGLSKGAR